MALFGGKTKFDASDPRAVWEEFFKLAMKNDWKKSLEMLNMLVRSDRQNPQVFMKLGDIQQRLGAKAESVEAYHKAAALTEEANELHKALATYKIILRLDPKDAKAAGRSREILQAISSGAAAQPAHAAEGGYEEMPAPATAPAGPEAAPVARRAPGPKAAPAEPVQASGPRDLREAFARHPIFSVLSDDEIKAMSAKANHISFNDGEVVIREDSEGDSIYVIKKGRARVTSTVMDSKLELASLGGLAFFGEGGFLTGTPRTATVTASAPLELMEIPKGLMSEIISSNPAVLGKLVDLLRARASKSPQK